LLCIANKFPFRSTVVLIRTPFLFLAPSFVDPEVVGAAVAVDGSALAHASPQCRNNPEVVTAAVQNYGLALAFASNELKANRDLVRRAVERDFTALGYASEDLQKDPQLVHAQRVAKKKTQLCNGLLFCW